MERCQTACKPGSVPSRSKPQRRWPFIWDVRCRTPRATYPDGGAKTCPGDRSPCRPYLVLLPVGFTLPLPLPGARCALTAPFHPCRAGALASARHGGLLSVALSLGSPPPAVSRHRVSVEPGLSSPDANIESGHPAVWRVLSRTHCCDRQLIPCRVKKKSNVIVRRPSIGTMPYRHRCE